MKIEWISVLDKVPGNERIVLVWLEINDKQIGPEFGWFDPFSKENNHNGWFIRCGKRFYGEVTFWAEIFPPLKNEEDLK